MIRRTNKAPSEPKQRRTRGQRVEARQTVAEAAGAVLLVAGVGALGYVLAGAVLAAAFALLLAGVFLVLVGNV